MILFIYFGILIMKLNLHNVLMKMGNIKKYINLNAKLFIKI